MVCPPPQPPPPPAAGAESLKRSPVGGGGGGVRMGSQSPQNAKDGRRKQEKGQFGHV